MPGHGPCARPQVSGKQPLRKVAAALRLAKAQALLLLGRLGDAATVLQRLAGVLSAPMA